MAMERKARGRSRVRKHTYDLDDKRAQIHAPLGEDLEGSALVGKAIIETLQLVRQQTAKAIRYGQGIVTRVGADALRTLLEAQHGFDHWSGTNDLAGSDIANRGALSKRQWQRQKPVLKKLGFIDYVHRSIKTGLSTASGVDQDLQVSDLYWFTPERLVPWIKEIYDAVIRRMVARAAAIARRSGGPRPRTPLVKRDRPHRRIPALLNPLGWARALAAEAAATARPTASYAEAEARAVAFATQLALSAGKG